MAKVEALTWGYGLLEGPRVDDDGNLYFSDVPNGGVYRLASSGEVDTYHFAVVKAATYIMSTEGPSDTVLTLHGPSDPGAVLAWDDDRGQGRNARIVRKLLPGDYWLSVRHKDTRALGTYTIGVKSRR